MPLITIKPPSHILDLLKSHCDLLHFAKKYYKVTVCSNNKHTSVSFMPIVLRVLKLLSLSGRTNMFQTLFFFSEPVQVSYSQMFSLYHESIIHSLSMAILHCLFCPHHFWDLCKNELMLINSLLKK